MSSNKRIEKDSMGELEVPATVLYAAQTQRAVNNFPISDLKMPSTFISSLGLIKKSAALANKELKLLEPDFADAIINAATKVAEGEYNDHFPVDVFQTGSGTSSNMNSNEVIANLAKRDSELPIHPNDHVNMGQSSNDVIPTAIHVSTCIDIHTKLIPALEHICQVLDDKAHELKDIAKTGRTHLMDAMPITLGQELGGWSKQLKNNILRVKQSLKDTQQLPIGGTAVGTGINAHPEFSKKVCENLSKITGIEFTSRENKFEAISSQDSIVALSGQIKTIAVSLMKISNDLRWMNSGPIAGISEIALPAIQPGSSIMPGKVNPVVPEAVCMVCAQVIGNDTTIAVAGQSGNFQLNVMLPVIAYNILQSINILANSCNTLANTAIQGFTVNKNKINELVTRNPILVTALNPVIGYEKGAKIAKIAYKDGKSVLEVAAENTDLSTDDLKRLLNPIDLTTGGIKS